MALTLKFSDAIVERKFGRDVKKDWSIGDDKPQRRIPCNAEVGKYEEFETQRHRGHREDWKSPSNRKVSAVKMSQLTCCGHYSRAFTSDQDHLCVLSASEFQSLSLRRFS